MEKYRTTLPAGYREVDVIDIKNDKRVRVWGDILSVLLSVLLRLIAAGLGGVAVIVLTCLLAAAPCVGAGRKRRISALPKGWSVRLAVTDISAVGRICGTP